MLAVGAHPDDVELGCGATLAKHALAGDEVYILVMTAGATSRPMASKGETLLLRRQAAEAAKIIGAKTSVLSYPDQRLDSVDRLVLIKSIESTITKVRPEVVYTHHGGDLNLDHRLTQDAVRVACRPLPGGSVRALYAFEVASSTEWGSGFWPTSFVDVSGVPLERKRLALACYTGEMREAPHPRSIEALSWLGRWRGATAAVEAAEAFELVRELR